MGEMVFFVAFGVVAVVAAAGVVAQRNVLYSGLLLILNMLCLAALYILMNAQFIGIVQIIVYAGAVMVLFIFTLMLLAGTRVELTSRVLPGQGPLAALFAVVLGVELLLLAGSAIAPQAPAPTAAELAAVGRVEAVAAALFGRYLWAFQATGLLLLIAAVGVVYLVKAGADASARR